jgi:hypothetical protein
MNYMKWFNEFSGIREFFVYKHVLQIFEQIRKQYWNDFDDHLKGLNTLNIEERERMVEMLFRSGWEVFFYFVFDKIPFFSRYDDDEEQILSPQTSIVSTSTALSSIHCLPCSSESKLSTHLEASHKSFSPQCNSSQLWKPKTPQTPEHNKFSYRDGVFCSCFCFRRFN